MIFIRAITKGGTLCDFDVIKGRPIEKIKWKGDTPYVNSPYIKTINEAAATLPMTSKLIWISDLRTGDYHENTNDKIVMKSITTKVILLVTRNDTGIHMLPVMEMYHTIMYAVYHTSQASPRIALSTSLMLTRPLK